MKTTSFLGSETGDRAQVEDPTMPPDRPTPAMENIMERTGELGPDDPRSEAWGREDSSPPCPWNGCRWKLNHRGDCVDASGKMIRSQPDPLTASYHTFTYRAPAEPLLPPDWYDGTPKKCPGSGQAPGVQYHGVQTEGGERTYLVRCPWCDSVQVPGIMPEHTFIPVRAEDLVFKTGRFMFGMEEDEPKLCDGDHGEPRCAAPCCHLDLSDDEIEQVIAETSVVARMAEEIRARRSAVALAQADKP